MTTDFLRTQTRSRRPRPAAGLAFFASALASALAAACGAPARSPADAASFTERTRCGPDVKEGDLAPVFSGHSVQSVGPLYATIEGGKSGTQAELRGAVLTLGAMPGQTAEWLDRELECHSARLTLGEAQSTPDDPFWLPGSIVDIDVRPTADGLVVGVAGYSADDARTLLEHAESFAKTRGPAAAR
jgi:hypothetical protein